MLISLEILLRVSLLNRSACCYFFHLRLQYCLFLVVVGVVSFSFLPRFPLTAGIGVGFNVE